MVVDVQNGFIDESHSEFMRKLRRYLKRNTFDNAIYTRFITHHKDNLYRDVKWVGLDDRFERKLALKRIPGSVMYDKKNHGLTKGIINYIQNHNITEIELCGIDNDGSIELIKNYLKFFNVNATINQELIAPTCIPTEAPVDKIYVYRSLNGFYIGDILANGKTFTDETILSFAVIEWLLHTEHSSQSLQNILKYYYKLFPNKNNIYESELVPWLENGCRTYRISDSFMGIPMTTAIGFYSTSLDMVDELVDSCLTVSYNSDEVKEAARVICYSIWYLKYNASKKDLLKSLNNLFPYEFHTDFDENRLVFLYSRTPINFAKVVLCAFFNSNTHDEALAIAQTIDPENMGAILSTTGALAEAYYLDISPDNLFTCREMLPPKFKQLLIDYGKHFGLLNY